MSCRRGDEFGGAIILADPYVVYDIVYGIVYG